MNDASAQFKIDKVSLVKGARSVKQTTCLELYGGILWWQLNNSIQSLVLTSNTNFSLLLAQFNASPSTTADPLMTEMTTFPTHSPTEEMDVDTDSRKREHVPCSGTARQQGKK